MVSHPGVAVKFTPTSPVHLEPSPSGGIWSQACPRWSSPIIPEPDPPMSPEGEAEAALLTKTLRTRLELPNDVKMLRFNESCDDFINYSYKYCESDLRV